ncbi:MAG TPA: metalloregulator ArsR/SmtB family transcription factor [Myxococcota bacterium]|jgi:DNA-binding transcriptional ArsR family regulator
MPRSHPRSDVYRAISHGTRRAILDRLRAGPARAGDLAAGFAETRPAISKHLRVLRQSGVVREERLGRERFYSLEPGPLHEVAGWVEGYRAFWHSSLARLKRHLEVK